MVRQFGYLSTDLTLLSLALKKCGSSLTTEPEAFCDGWGMGFYQDDRALIRKRPAELHGPIDLARLAEDVRSHCVIVHTRRGLRGAPSPQNTQPFRFRNWLFSHIGEATWDDASAKQVLDALPDFLARNVRGQSDSEPALHLFFDKLRTRARVDATVLPVEALVDSMRETIAELHAIALSRGHERPPTLDFLFATGRMLVASNFSGSTLATLEVGALERFEKPLFAGHEPKRIDYPHFRGVFVAFNPTGVDGDWKRTEGQSIVVVDEKINIHVHPIAI